MNANVMVIEKNVGTKIPWQQNGSKLVFGDDELMVNCAKYQKDWPTHLDICGDKNGNLVIGVGEGRYYVAQIAIPAKEYIYPEPVEYEGEESEGAMGQSAPPELVPFTMADVALTLWAIDGLRN